MLVILFEVLVGAKGLGYALRHECCGRVWWCTPPPFFSSLTIPHVTSFSSEHINYILSSLAFILFYPHNFIVLSSQFYYFIQTQFYLSTFKIFSSKHTSIFHLTHSWIKEICAYQLSVNQAYCPTMIEPTTFSYFVAPIAGSRILDLL